MGDGFRAWRRGGRPVSGYDRPVVTSGSDRLPTRHTFGVHHVDIGRSATGEPVFVLVHGLGTSLTAWRHIVPLLAGRGRVIALDLPGFARSRAPEGPCTLDAAADVISDFLDHLDVHDVVLVGHSLGAVVAMQVANLRSDVSRVVLICGTVVSSGEIMAFPRTAVRHPRVAAAIIGHVWRNATRSLHLRGTERSTPRERRPGPAAERERATSPMHSTWRVLRASRRFDVPGLLREVRQPVALVWSRADRLVPLRDVEVARRLLPVEAELALDDAGHFPLATHAAAIAGFVAAPTAHQGTS